MCVTRVDSSTDKVPRISQVLREICTFSCQNWCHYRIQYVILIPRENQGRYGILNFREKNNYDSTRVINTRDNSIVHVDANFTSDRSYRFGRIPCLNIFPSVFSLIFARVHPIIDKVHGAEKKLFLPHRTFSGTRRFRFEDTRRNGGYTDTHTYICSRSTKFETSIPVNHRNIERFVFNVGWFYLDLRLQIITVSVQTQYVDHNSQTTVRTSTARRARTRWFFAPR